MTVVTASITYRRNGDIQKDTTWFKPTYIYKVWEQFLKSQQ